ncbi:MAG: hypothetical protein GWO24_03295 [Akkermansiaceae bacterium]|nr:hypothetical protein [Akkermansiaceae bacterium]
MRRILSISAAVLCLAVFPSCSSSKVTKADLAAFKLRDLTRFGQPHIVKVSAEEVQQLDETALQSGRLASLSKKHQVRVSETYYAPVNYVPPRLPKNAVGFDGSILPPKTAGGSAVPDRPGSLPGRDSEAPSYPVSPPQNFSTE